MLILRKLFIRRYTQPLLFSKMLESDLSFLTTLESLSAEDILLLRDSFGTVFYYLIMSLYCISDNSSSSSDAIKARIKKLLSEAIVQSSLDRDQVIPSQVNELREIANRLKASYMAISNNVCKTLLNVMGNDALCSEEDIDPKILQQNMIKNGNNQLISTVRAIKILADKINTAVAEQRCSVEEVSEFLSYSGKDACVPVSDVMSALVDLYFILDNLGFSDLAYLLAKVFLVNFAQYKLDAHGRNAIHYAVNMCTRKTQDKFLSEIICSLISEKPSIVSALDNYGNNVMHYAMCAVYMNYKVIKYFIENFPNMITQQNCYGDTPLHIMTSVYFVNFSRVLLLYMLVDRDNLKSLRRVNSENVTLSEMKESVAYFRQNDELLSADLESYINECVSSYRLLLTVVPLREILERRNNVGITVYDIIRNYSTNICNKDFKALLQDFSNVSRKLPIYDNRVHLKRDVCLQLCFSDEYQHISKGVYGRVLYLYTKRICDLISDKFTEISNAKTILRDFQNENSGFVLLSFFLLFTIFLLVFILNIVLYFKKKAVLGIKPGLYRTVLFAVISINICAVFCMFCFLYYEYITLDQNKFILEEQANIENILLSRLNIEEVNVAQRTKDV